MSSRRKSRMKNENERIPAEAPDPSTRQKNPVDSGMGSSQCCICAVVEKDDKNLHAAGMLHWNEKKTNYAHLKYVTEKLKEMASSVGRKSISNEQTCFQRCQM